MADDSASSFTETGESSIPVNQILQILQNLNPNKQTAENANLQSVNISAKLSDHNYTLWSKLMYLAINGRGKIRHITFPSPSTTDPTYQKWREADSIVLTWIIENIGTDLVNQYLNYLIAYDLWKAIQTTYNSGRDQLQVYDLTVKEYSLK